MARRSRIRWLFWPILGAVGVVSVVRSEGFSDAVCRILEASVEALTGERTTVRDIRIGVGTVSLLGVDIVHPATNEGILRVDAITASLGWAADAGPLIGGPVWRRLTVLRPEVNLHVDADGLREFRGLSDLGGGGSNGAGEHFPWRELVIESGSLQVSGGDAWEARVAGITLTPTHADHADLVLGEVVVRLGELRLADRPVVLRNLRWSPAGIGIPALNLSLAEGNARPPLIALDGAIDVQFGKALTGDLSARFSLAELTPGLPRWNRPDAGWTDGVVVLDATLLGTPEAPDIAGVLSVTGLTIHSGLPRRLGDLLGDWRLDLTGAAPHLRIADATMRWGPGVLGVDADLNLLNGTLAGTVRAESVSLAHILTEVGVAPTPWVDFTADVETSVVGTIAPFRLEGPFEIDLTQLEVGDAPLGGPHETLLYVPYGSLGGDLTITADHMVLDSQHLRAGPTRGRAVADIGFAEDGPLRVDVSLPELDLSWLAPLNDLGLDGLASVDGVIEGPYTALRATGTLDGRGVVVLGLGFADSMSAEFTSDMRRLDFENVRALLGQTLYEGHFGVDLLDGQRINTRFDIVDGHAADLVGMFVDLGAADARISGSISLEGTPYNLSGPAEFVVGEGSLWGERITGGLARGEMRDGEFTLTDLRLSRPGLRGRVETLRARGTVRRGYAMNIELLSDGLMVENLQTARDYGVTGDIMLDARVRGTLYDWEPEGRLGLRNVRVFGEPVADSVFRFDTRHGPIVDTLAWTGSLLGGAADAAGTVALAREGAVALNVKFDAFPFSFFYPRSPDGAPIETSLTGSLALSGGFGDAPVPLSVQGDLQSVSLAWSGHVLKNEAPWAFALRDGTFEVPPLTLLGNDGTRVEFAGSARPGAATAEGLPPVLFEGDGTVNLDLLRAVVPELREVKGSARVHLRIDNTAEDTVTLDASIRDAVLRSGYFPATFENVQANIKATGRGYSLDGLRANVGGGNFVGRPSMIFADGWVPERYALSGQLRDVKVQYLDYLPPMRGDADLSFDGPVGDLLLAGDIEIREMLWTDRIDWEAMVVSVREERLTAAAPDPSANYFGMNLHVTADQTLKLRNNVADADASCDLRVMGDTSRPGMTGVIRLVPNGRMYLNEQDFEIARAEVRYLDPFSFDPDLDLVLETDLRSQDQDYRIRYLVSGPFSDWRTTTSSDPYLSQADINALLLFGVTREELERFGGLGSALLAETGDLLLGQTALSRTNIFVVDRWSLVSGVTERGTPTLSSDLRLVAQKRLGGFDVTVETALGQNLGRDWYASVERRIAQRLYATAWMATEQEGRTLPIGSAYGLDLKLRLEAD